MRLSNLERALLETDKYYQCFFRACYFSLVNTGRQDYSKINPDGVLFLAFQRKFQSRALSQETKKLLKRMNDSEEQIKIAELILDYTMPYYISKVIKPTELVMITTGQKVSIEISDLTVRLYGEKPESYRRRRGLNSFTRELEKFRETLLPKLKWKVIEITPASNWKFYDSIVIWIGED